MGQQFELFSRNNTEETTTSPKLKSLILSKANTPTYENLNKKISKLHKEKKRFESKISEIKRVNRIFNERIGPLEKTHLDLQVDYLKNLDKFLTKKNIPKIHIEIAELEIQNTVEYLSTHNHATEYILEITNKYHKKGFEDLSEEELEDARFSFDEMNENFKNQSGQDLPFSFEDFISTPIEELMSGFHQQAQQNFAEEEAEQKAEIKKERQNFDDDVFKKLYKKLAKVLHPDLKSSLIPDQTKEQLIKELSEAWENRNYIKILEINSFVYPDDTDLKFTQAQIKNLENQVDNELKELKFNLEELKYAKAKELDIYNYFHSKSAKKQDSNFRNGEKEVQDKINYQTLINRTVFKSVKKTKDFLNDKKQAHAMQFFMDSIIDFD